MHRLDGLPLAIELAAARIRLLSPEAMLARLGRRSGPADGRSRATCRLGSRRCAARSPGATTCSTSGEQRLFRRLGVFVGGFTLDAAEAVCTGEGDLGIDLLDGLESLVSKSLVKQQAGAAR